MLVPNDGFVPADFSPCRTWRYTLRRRWGSGSVAGFVLLNPSTADETQDDPTIRRCIGFAKAWGYGGLVLGNLFAYRATKPDAMKRAPDPIGPDNDAWLAKIADEAGGSLVCGWGLHGTFRDRASQVISDLGARGVTLLALGHTDAGEPRHPLYLPGRLLPVRHEARG